MKWWQRNLARRPASPATGNGRIQRQITRSFIAQATDTRTTAQILDWVYPARSGPLKHCQKYAVWRRLVEMCDRLGRTTDPGKPYVWRLKAPPPASDNGRAS